MRGDLDENDRSVPLAMAPRPVSVQPRIWLANILEEGGNVFRRPDLLDGHGEEFRVRVAILLYGGTIDRQKHQRLPIENPHRLRIIFKKQAVTLLRAFDLPLRSSPLRNVSKYQ